jgi:hypothetical protein
MDTVSTRWTYVTDRAPKPFVHPLHAPSGRLLTTESPEDHLWHRGLWFTIKYIDGENFWEEDPPFGTQKLVGDNRLDWTHSDGRVAISEQRTLTEVDLGPGAYALDWTSTLSAAGDAPVELERTPYTTWGGYGGLAFRGAGDWENTRILVADGSEHRRAVAVESPWADLSGPDAGITFLDHPDNPRHPTPWYGASRSRVYGEAGWSNFLNAAFLFHGGITLEPDSPLTLRYRVVVHDGQWDAARAQAAFDQWTA